MNLKFKNDSEELKTFLNECKLIEYTDPKTDDGWEWNWYDIYQHLNKIYYRTERYSFGENCSGTERYYYNKEKEITFIEVEPIDVTIREWEEISH